MTAKEKVLNREKERGKLAALSLQEKSSEMTGTELNAVDDTIPLFSRAIEQKNMLERHADMRTGFVCVSPEGRVVRLIQNYDSDIYKQTPEELPAQWAFVWSTDPAKAKPFIAMATSPYHIGECCLDSQGRAWASKIDTNIWSPDNVPLYWELCEEV